MAFYTNEAVHSMVYGTVQGVLTMQENISIATQLIAVNHDKTLLDAMSAKKHPLL